MCNQQFMKMRYFSNLTRRKNLGNVLNVIIGLRNWKAKTEWFVFANSNFAITVVFLGKIAKQKALFRNRIDES